MKPTVACIQRRTPNNAFGMPSADVPFVVAGVPAVEALGMLTLVTG
jgi:hypothetical protein